MSLPLFCSPDGNDDAERVIHFHERLERDEATPPHPARASTNPSTAGSELANILSAIRDGDRAALAALYDALFDPLWRIAVLQTRSSESAKDVVHDVFLWLWTHRAAIAVDLDIRVYLATAVRNRARDAGKHARVANTVASNASATQQIPALGQAAVPVDEQTERNDFLSAYRRALTLLTERELTAALLRWEEDFTLEQIANVLGVSAMGARGIVLRAQQKLRRALKDFQ